MPAPLTFRALWTILTWIIAGQSLFVAELAHGAFYAFAGFETEILFSIADVACR